MKIKNLNVQSLRGIAVISVILFHLEPDLFSGGFIGIDLFLFISGFVLYPSLNKILQKNDFYSVLYSTLLFLSSRAKRLFPTFFVSVSLFLPIILLLVPVGRDMSLAFQQLLSAFFVIANWSASSTSSDYFSHYPNLFLHLWSLSYEEQIYLLIIIFILCLYPIKSLRKNGLMAIAIVFFVLFLTSGYPNHSYYNFTFRLWEVGLGLVIGKLSAKIKLHLPLNFTRCCFIVVLIIALVNVEPVLIYRTFLLLVFSSLIIMQSESGAEGESLLSKVGNRSYALYLTHYPFIVFTKHYISATPQIRYFFIMLSFIMSIITAEFLYRKIEVRILNETFWIDLKRRYNVKRGVSVSAITVVLICALSWGINESRFFGFNEHAVAPKFQKILFECDVTESFKDACVFGQSTRSIALVGDSHASAIAPVFLAVSRDLDVTLHVYAYKGCKYVKPELLSKLGKTLIDKRCLLRNNLVNIFLKDNTFDVVYFAFRSQDCSNNEFAGLCGDTLTKKIIKSLEQEEEAIVLTPVPEFEDVNLFPPRRLLETYVAASRTYPKLAISDQVIRDTENIIKNSSVKYINTMEHLCDEAFCYRKKAGQWLWVDSNHLSKTGAMKLQKSIILTLTRLGD